METLRFVHPGRRRIARGRACLVGVVASGNLEVLIEPAVLQGNCSVEIDTAAPGFGPVWQAVVADFHGRHGLSDVRIAVNDNGATPATVSLRLDQAVEEFVERAGEPG